MKSVIENFVCYVKTSLDNCFLTFALNPFLKIICIWDLLLLRFDNECKCADLIFSVVLITDTRDIYYI